MKQFTACSKNIYYGPAHGLSISNIAKTVSDPVFLWECSAVVSTGNSPLQGTQVHSRFAYLGIGVEKTLTIHQGQIEIHPQPSQQSTQRQCLDPLSELSSFLHQTCSNYQSLRQSLEQHLNANSIPPFIDGAVGFLAYDAVSYFERIKGASLHAVEPEAFFVVPQTLLVLDQEQEMLLIISSASTNELRLALQDSPRTVSSTSLQNHAPSSTTPPLSGTLSENTFVKMVEKAKEYIAAGDIFQVVLANTFALDTVPNPISLYQTLRHLNPSPYHFYIRFGEQSLVGASPEVMLRSLLAESTNLPTSSVFTRPVAGTYPRDQNAAQSVEQSIEKLPTDKKECAEHIMLIDLARNDLGRVARIGSVEVSDLFSVETYSHVHHLVSQVSCQLASEESALSALRASFPIGTLAGTPKIRAMEIIAELEGPSRGIFGGAVIMAGSNGYLDSGVAIRSAVLGPKTAVIRAGAGIVHDSIPEREYRECLWKAEAMRRAISQSILQAETL